MPQRQPLNFRITSKLILEAAAKSSDSSRGAVTALRGYIFVFVHRTINRSRRHAGSRGIWTFSCTAIRLLNVAEVGNAVPPVGELKAVHRGEPAQLGRGEKRPHME